VSAESGVSGVSAVSAGGWLLDSVPLVRRRVVVARCTDVTAVSCAWSGGQAVCGVLGRFCSRARCWAACRSATCAAFVRCERERAWREGVAV
jgi:hypothetical protein